MFMENRVKWRAIHFAVAVTTAFIGLASVSLADTVTIPAIPTGWAYYDEGHLPDWGCFTSESAMRAQEIAAVQNSWPCPVSDGADVSDWPDTLLPLGGGSYCPVSPKPGLIAYELPLHTEQKQFLANTPGYSTVNGFLDCSFPGTRELRITRHRFFSCPNGFSLQRNDPGLPTCVTDLPVKQLGCDVCTKSSGGGDGNSSMANNPINVAIGNKYEMEVDYQGSGPFPLAIRRHYNSLTGIWSSDYERSLGIDGDLAALFRADGKIVRYTNSNGTWVGDPDVVGSLTQLTDTWRFVNENDQVEIYDNHGKLLSVTDRSGVAHTVAYDDLGRIASVKDSFGHQLTYTYDGSARAVQSITDPAGGTILYSSIVYAPDESGYSTVTYQDGSSKTYVWNEPTHTGSTYLPLALTGIVDENGTRFATFDYDSSGRIVHEEHAGGADSFYVAVGPNGSVTTTDAAEGVRTYAYQTSYGIRRIASQSGGPCAVCANTYASYVYDDNGNAHSKVDFNGNTTSSTFDLTRNLETLRTEAQSTPRARTIATGWSSGFRLPTSISVYAGGSATGAPIKTSSLSYDGSGNLLTRTETDPGATPVISRTWTYTYDGYGRVLTADGPRTDISDVTTYTYYTCTTGAECGQIHTVTDAAGHVTTYNTYNAHGQPLTISDPNGVVTTLTYDARQRLTSRAIGTETTTFSYWPTGLLKRVTQPDGSYVQYTYDTAHRLMQIADGAANKIAYTLDAMGNRTAENAYDPSNVLHRTHSRVINSLNQLYKDINSAGTAAVTTTYGYDSNGNQTTIAAPLARSTGNQYDELNRLKQITDPGSGVTQFGYDANDNLTSVTDPRTLTTAYTYNGLGDLKTLVSPDTGTTSNTYDSGGNLATSTNARGAVATYSYDTLNRPSSVAYAIGGVTDQTIGFTYDAGTYGKGHLTGASDANHALTWVYDALGRVTSKTQVVGTSSLTVGYGYTDGNLTTLTTPSGNVVRYAYNSNHQVSGISVNNIAVLAEATYEPFGAVSGWTWGNGTAAVRTYDGDGNVSAISSAGSKSYSYDDASRITGITDAGNSALSWGFGYDTLDRLNAASTTTQSQSFTYDANGNRLTQGGDVSSTFTVDSASNRLSAVSGGLTRTYTYDSAGNTTGYGGNTFTYNAAGRLILASNANGTTAYVYNALGQRIRKSSTASATMFAYDESGHLIGEYDPSGNLIEEIVWLGDSPVATVRLETCGMSIFYIHTDHLNTPRSISRRSTSQLVWSWESDPFGTTVPNENPSGLGRFSFNLRLPGQYYDQETGLTQNYMRDDDPVTGRYIESDPMGLLGGINTYTYVDSSPLWNIDLTGLQAVDPGQNLPDPAPGRRGPGNANRRDPRTPWLPPNLQHRSKYCPPYWRIVTGISDDDEVMAGLIPLVWVEVIKETECEKTIVCHYYGAIASGMKWAMGAKKAKIENYGSGTVVTVPKKGKCCENK